ncbi:MAG: ATP-dependent sacrificial sulfur transferase LarE [Desulfobulbus sp.]|nr:ATP-dependent sacrificial sulfur transferase LarE [Desulfobulbus sp.]
MALSQRQKAQYAKLLVGLRAMEGVVVAFSGGVDSVLLLHAACQVLSGRVLAVTFVTPYTPEADVNDARLLAATMQVCHRVIKRSIPAAIKGNPPDRCYLCKRELFGTLSNIAEEEGMEYLLDGSNMDDLDDYRPGLRAVRELGVLSPFIDAGLSKQDIRDLSCEQGLPTWDKPAGGCLLTRIPYGITVTEEELQRIDQGERFLKLLGFASVRLRSHGPLARIELPPESIAACLDPQLRGKIDTRLKKMGYRFVTVDLAGYRMGSLNPPGTGTGLKK